MPGWMSVLLGFALGIPASFIASSLYDFAKAARARSKLRVEGTWGEFVPDSVGRQYSLGRIYFHRRRKLLAFDGTNFTNDGRAYCHWETVASHIDFDSREFFYVFIAHLETELDRRFYGFGVVNLATDSTGTLVPARGHYVSANVEDRPMSHSMLPIYTIQYSSEVTGEEAVRVIEEARNQKSHNSSQTM